MYCSNRHFHVSFPALALCAALAMANMSWAGAPGKSLGRTLTTGQRIEPEHLAAARADSEKYQSQRTTIAPLDGVTDYRAILHLHVEDSDHTGGTFAELIPAAKKTGVSIIMLTDHFRPPKDFMNGRRGLQDGILFMPGCEGGKGYLLYPESSVMDCVAGPKETLIERTSEGNGLIFLSHVEERPLESMEGLTGAEIYNRHADAMDDMAALMQIAGMMTTKAGIEALQNLLATYHDEFMACQLDYPDIYLKSWDRETLNGQLTGIAANDCHHNMVLIMKMRDENTVAVGTIFDSDNELRPLTTQQFPGIPELTKGHQPGDELARLDLDTYENSFRTVSTHILAEKLDEEVVRKALKAGHAYVSFDWMCDPTGFRYVAVKKEDVKNEALKAGNFNLMGDEVILDDSPVLVAEFPVACTIRLMKNGQEVAKTQGARLEYTPEDSGIYRVEGWLTVDGEQRIWILSNPLHVL